MIAHYSLVNRLSWMQKKYPIDQSDTILQKTPFTFDVSVWELFWWGISGARLSLLIPGGEKDPGVILEAVEKNNVTVMHFVPSMLNAFLTYVEMENAQNRLASLNQVFASGEALPLSLVNSFNDMLSKPNRTRLANLYGPTEATIDVSFFDCSTGKTLGKIPIGKPIDNIKLYVVDKYLKLQPIGISGELCISGHGLSKGYLNRPQLTAERFCLRPPGGSFCKNRPLDPRKNFLLFPAPTQPLTHSPYSPIYKTGDLARWLPDGNIEFLGRLDHQVKIRGFRVELEEIENHILMHDEIKDAVVISTDGSPNPEQRQEKGEEYLCAYIVSDKEFSLLQMRIYLARSLPDYMIPSSFIRIDHIPLTPNGKVDRKALNTSGQKLGTGVEYVAPQNEIEKIIAEIWKQELNLDKVGIYDNFFDLGGNSLHILQMRNKLKEQLGRNIPIARIFTYTTIDSFSRYLQEEEIDDISSDEKISESADLMEETMQLLMGDDNE